MMFAIQLIMGPEDIKEKRITDAYSVHRAIYDLFSRERSEDSEHSGFLYADLGGSKLGRKIIIISNRKPINGKLSDSYIEIKQIPETFLDLDIYRYQLIINPTFKNNLDKKRKPIKNPDEIKEWFKNRSSQWGFSLQSVEVDSVKVLRFKKSGKMVTIEQAKVSGILSVIDRDLFKKSFFSGLGRAKAFGCGLLQICPV